MLSSQQDGNSPDDYLKTLSSNDPQLVCYTGRDGVQDPTSHQWFVVVDKEILMECESHLGREVLITLIAVHFAFNLEYHSSHRKSLHSSQVAHQAGAYPRFCSMKRLRVFLLPPGWDASPSQGYPQH